MSDTTLSAAPPNFAPVHLPDSWPHPWRRLREQFAHVTLAWHEGGPMGLTTHSTATVSLRRGLSWEQRRCTLEHELIHVETGPVPRGLREKDEERVRRETARRMIPNIRPVGDAIAWALSGEEAAQELGVDLAVLEYRLRHMSPMERAWLNHRLEQHDAITDDFSVDVDEQPA